MASEKEFFRCEICNKMIILKNVHLHQAECQSENDDLLNKYDSENKDVRLPCEFCEILIELNNLICHQIICRKKLKKIKNNVSNHNKNTESSLNYKNILQSSVNETFHYQDEYNQNLSSVHNAKDSVQNSCATLDLNLPSTSKIYTVPTLVLRKPKLNIDQSCNSSFILKESKYLPVKSNSDKHLSGVSDMKLNKHNDKSPFLNSRGRGFHQNSRNVSYSEHNYVYSVPRGFTYCWTKTRFLRHILFNKIMKKTEIKSWNVKIFKKIKYKIVIFNFF